MDTAARSTVRLQYRPYTLDPAFPVFSFSARNRPSGGRQPMDEQDTARYMHLHNCVEITCVTCEEAHLAVESEMHTLHKGDVVIVMPFTPHFLTGDHASCDYLYFDPTLLLSGFAPGLMNRFPTFCEGKNACLIIPAAQTQELSRCIGRLLRELEEKQAEYRACASSLLITLMVEALRCASPTACAVQPAGSVLSIMPAVDHINRCYMQPISIRELQQLCHLSGTQLRRVFHSVMGCAPLAYIQQVRISHACEQLLSTRRSLTEIAAAVGFDSVSSFHRQFVHYHGEAPSRWRKRHASPNALRLPDQPFDPRN